MNACNNARDILDHFNACNNARNILDHFNACNNARDILYNTDARTSTVEPISYSPVGKLVQIIHM